MGLCCPTRFRTWTLLNQNQTCCQLHHRTVYFVKIGGKSMKKNTNREVIKNKKQPQHSGAVLNL